MPTGKVLVEKRDGHSLGNSKASDLVIVTESSTQNILLGSNGTEASLAITSSEVQVSSNRNLRVEGTLLANRIKPINADTDDKEIIPSNKAVSILSSGRDIVKMTTTGEWSVKLGPTEATNSMCVSDSQGNAYVACYYSNTLNIYSSKSSDMSQSIGTVANPTNRGIALTKFSSNGTLLWTNRIEGVQSGINTTALSIDKDDNVYIMFSSNVTNTNFYNADGSQVNSLTLTNPNAPLSVTAITKINTNGDFQWVVHIKTYGNNGSKHILMKVGQDGNIYVNGFLTEGTNNSLSGIPFVLPISDVTGTSFVTIKSGDVISFNNKCLWVLKIDKDGVVKWSVSLVQNTTDIYTDADSFGNVYVNCTSNPPIVTNADGSVSNVNSQINQSDSGYILKFNSSGILQPDFAFLRDSSSRCIKVDKDNNLIINAISCTKIHTNKSITDFNGSLSGIFKLASDFSFLWFVPHPHNISDINVDNDDCSVSFITKGMDTITYNADGSPNNFLSANNISPDNMYILKFNKFGYLQWISVVSVTGYYNFHSVISNAGSIFVFWHFIFDSTTISQFYTSDGTLSTLTFPPGLETTPKTYIMKFKEENRLDPITLPYKLLSNLTSEYNLCQKMLLNCTTRDATVNIRNQTDTETKETIIVPAKGTQTLVWYDGEWYSNGEIFVW